MSGWRNAGLRLSDRGLYLQGVISNEQKIVLAAQQWPTAMDETIAQLAARLPYDQQQIKAARAALQKNGILTLTEPQRLTDAQRACPGLRRGRRVTHVDERLTKTGGYSVFVPGTAVEALMAVTRRGLTPPLLLLMLYTRVQAENRSAVFVYEQAARRDLGLTAKVIKRANGILKESGLMQQVGTHNGTPIYVLSFLPSNPAGTNLDAVRRDTTRHRKRDSELTEESCPLDPGLSPSRPLVASLSTPLIDLSDLRPARLSLTSFEIDDASGVEVISEGDSEAASPDYRDLERDRLRAAYQAGELTQDEFFLALAATGFVTPF